MTNLTDKWIKGELTEGFYYYKLPNGEINIGTDFKLATLMMCKDGDKIEVLDQVPSWEDHQIERKMIIDLTDENERLKKWCEEFNALDVAKENTKLKELLKTHKLLFELEKDNTQNVLQRGKYAYLINDIDQVLADNKIQANTVVCNKIQEKNNG